MDFNKIENKLTLISSDNRNINLEVCENEINKNYASTKVENRLSINNSYSLISKRCFSTKSSAFYAYKTTNDINITNKTFKSAGLSYALVPGPLCNNLNIIKRDNSNNWVRYLSPLREKNKGINIGYKPRFYSTMRGCSSKLWVDYSVFNLNDLDKFKKDIFYSGKIEVGVEYSVIFKIRKGDIYYMLGTKQKKVVFNSYDDEYFEELFELIQDRLQLLFEEYTKELEYECDTILLDF